jgi:stage V sporulation protein SpoVS
MRLRTRIFLLYLLLGLSSQGTAVVAAETLELGRSQLDSATLAVIFSGSETLHYAVSWGGGVKIGDIYIKITREKTRQDAFNISAKVKDYGPLKVIYPVDDTFNCFVSGPMKLPYRYDVHQKEGYRRETTRLTHYDQVNHLVRYQKNKKAEQQFVIAGTVYNEFASFIITRALLLQEGEDLIVPTFADKKRQEVKVALVQREKRATIFGEKTTLKIQPKMHFKGLYEKSGNTFLWLTDDRCRVPVEIHSKIVVGSLVAELVDYANPACPELRGVKKH